MRVLILGFFLFNSYFGYSQSFFRLSGTIHNPQQDFVTFTIYSDWISEPKNYTLKLGQDNSYIIEIPLSEISYCDLSFGEHGLDLLKIEPGDKIHLDFDNNDFYSTLHAVGAGSDKWMFQTQLKRKFEVEKDWDVDLSNFKGLSQNAFFAKTEEIQNQQLDLLNEQKESFSAAFYDLQKADIIGKFKLKELGFLNSIKASQSNLKVDWFAFSEYDKVRSIFMSQLLDNLIEQSLSQKNYTKSIGTEYDVLKGLQYNYGKGIVEKTLASKLIDHISSKGIDEEIRLLAEDYSFFADNEGFKNLVSFHILKKLRLERGKTAPNFILRDKKGKLTELSDFRGKNLVLGFYEVDCFLCQEDLEAMEYVQSFYRVLGKKDLEFVFVNLSSKEEYKEFLKQQKPLGVHLNGHNDVFLSKNYNIQFLPNYLVIDKGGKIVSSSVDEPRLDNGRSLIELLGREIYP